MIKKNDVVSLAYTLKNSEGVDLGKADAKEPMNYLHGVGGNIPGLEEEIEGLKVGDKKDVTVPPEKGYGDVDPKLFLKVARSNFPADMDIKPDMQFSSEMGGKENIFTVESIDGENLNVNGNHPLAGQTLHFSLEILGIRDATEEELAHGHVHDGTHHH